MKLSLGKICFGIATCVVASPVFAQLEEIIVTAERRAVNIQDVPVSVQSFGEQELSDAVIHQPVQLGELTPGLQYSKQAGQANPYIRGIGTQNTTVGDESTVATYVDGVYIASMRAAATSLNNIERIEVLKGPQGTLFGRNTTGGLIHIITKDPSHDRSMRIGLDYAEYDTFKGTFYGTTGISDSLAADISLTYLNQGDGYGDNLVTGNEVNKTEDFVARTKWLFEPSEKLTIKFTADYAETKTDIASARGPMEGAIGIDGALVLEDCLGAGGTPAACSAAAQAMGTGPADDPHDVRVNAEGPSELEQFGVALNFTYEMENFDIVSITSYRDSEVDAFLDQDATPLPVIDATLDREEEQFSQEIQLVSNNDGQLNWILGAFYMDADSHYAPFQLAGVSLPLLVPGVTFLDMQVTQSLESRSVFGQGTYDLTERWAFTAGIRYTDDERKMDGVTTVSFGSLDVPLAFDVSDSFSEATWRFALDYKVNEDMMLYASYNRGFKSGVFNSVVTSGAPAPAVEPEIVDAFEIGLKSQWADGRLRSHIAGFYYEYEDLQLQFVSAGATILGNASDAEILGAEATINAAITENFSMRLGLSYLNTEYQNYPTGLVTVPTDLGFGPVGGNTVSFADVSGNKMARAPEFTSSLGAGYTHPVSNTMNFNGNINWYYNDGFFWFEDNRVKQSSYHVVNAEISLSSANERWKFKIWAKNLFDEDYSIYTNTGRFGDLVAFAPPRVAGAGVEFNF